MPSQHKSIKALEGFIFWSRWLQAPLYVGLIVAQGVYVFHFMQELLHLIEALFGHGQLVQDAITNGKITSAAQYKLGETDIMLIVLGLIDVVMIANLLIMVIIGGYETFVSRLDLDSHPDQPEWLSHVNAGVLKVKLAMALIGISSIHLLKTFINAPQLDEKTMRWQVIIHVTFVLSAFMMAYTDKVTNLTLKAMKQH
jgi:uncharacterized protein (TIGR00645 family)